MSAGAGGVQIVRCPFATRVELAVDTEANLVILPKETFGAAETDRLSAVFEKEGNAHLVVARIWTYGSFIQQATGTSDCR
jgi:hypothetical protein